MLKNMNDHWSVRSSMALLRLLEPWPERVSMRMTTGLAHACLAWSVAANLNEWAGTTRSSWSAVVTIVAG